MATLLFENLWENDQVTANKAMAAIIAISIFGNLWVMKITAVRVKQEISKEAILGSISLYIASSYRTPWGICKQWFRGSFQGEEIEQAPTRRLDSIGLLQSSYWP